jgi:shikimate kinase
MKPGEQAPAIGAREAPRNVILIGYRGCGKTSVGRLLARHLQYTFVDTDDRIVAAAGRPISEIFARDGEGAFRKLEAEVVRGLARGTGQVISVGGGAVLLADNRDALRAAGPCVWLTAAPEVLHARLQTDARTAASRPPLTDREALEEIRHLLAERAPLYAALADHVIETTGMSVQQAVAAVAAALQPAPPASDSH